MNLEGRAEDHERRRNVADFVLAGMSGQPPIIVTWGGKGKSYITIHQAALHSLIISAHSCNLLLHHQAPLLTSIHIKLAINSSTFPYLHVYNRLFHLLVKPPPTALAVVDWCVLETITC